MDEKGKALLSDISDDDIAEIIKKAKKEAAEYVRGLGMEVKEGKWQERKTKNSMRVQPSCNESQDDTMERDDKTDDNNDNDDNNEENDDDDDICTCDGANKEADAPKSNESKMMLEDILQ